MVASHSSASKSFSSDLSFSGYEAFKRDNPSYQKDLDKIRAEESKPFVFERMMHEKTSSNL